MLFYRDFGRVPRFPAIAVILRHGRAACVPVISAFERSLMYTRKPCCGRETVRCCCKIRYVDTVATVWLYRILLATEPPYSEWQCDCVRFVFRRELKEVAAILAFRWVASITYNFNHCVLFIHNNMSLLWPTTGLCLRDFCRLLLHSVFTARQHSLLC